MQAQARAGLCIIVACLTNFIVASSGVGEAASVRVEPVLLDVRQILDDLCSCAEYVLVCPPMYRSSPLWYRDGLSEVMGKFSQIMTKEAR